MSDRFRRWVCFWRGCEWMEPVENRKMCSRCRTVVRAGYYRALLDALHAKP